MFIIRKEEATIKRKEGRKRRHREKKEERKEKRKEETAILVKFGYRTSKRYNRKLVKHSEFKTDLKVRSSISLYMYICLNIYIHTHICTYIYSSVYILNEGLH